jgi:hypothetical protein
MYIRALQQLAVINTKVPKLVERNMVPLSRMVHINQRLLEDMRTAEVPCVVQTGLFTYDVVFEDKLYHCDNDIRKTLVMMLWLMKTKLGGIVTADGI